MPEEPPASPPPAEPMEAEGDGCVTAILLGVETIPVRALARLRAPSTVEPVEESASAYWREVERARAAGGQAGTWTISSQEDRPVESWTVTQSNERVLMSTRDLMSPRSGPVREVPWPEGTPWPEAALRAAGFSRRCRRRRSRLRRGKRRLCFCYFIVQRTQ